MTEKAAANTDKLAKIHQDIEKDYPGVSHLSSLEMTTLIERGDDLIIFDVRKPEEYGVSHLPGAVRLDPKMQASVFKEKYGAHLSDKTVIFYCSVGRRSSLMVERLEAVLDPMQTDAVYNLEGGIFNWHNQALPLRRGEVSGEVSTLDVHPYNWLWGRSLERRDYIRYSPASGR